MTQRRRFYPFTAEQTVNILSEFGPLVAMFIVNAIAGINAGTWALMITTGLAMVAMLRVLGRLPIFPLIASSVTVAFGAMTLLTGDPMWIQIKVTIFNIMFAVFLFGGLMAGKNFFKYIFEQTFHYTKEGWDRFTWSFAWFFVLTAILNEVVRQTFIDTHVYDVLGFQMDGVNIWILFKVAFIMPLSGLYAWYLTRLMQKYRIEDKKAPAEVGPGGVATAGKGMEFAKPNEQKKPSSTLRQAGADLKP
ncbi:putative intracellular septation protein A [Candidatus Filomicrobium marinum]|uniref:Intracellular septation protein n=2 Tax=Filomicrobium TaxID=119044 RepID=A0A1H0TVW0_9HYPH|nr:MULTISPECIES: septation protein IspZ [Filomicrobium]MCV0370639.1 septation protein IspZ [Filomicrobium sp.]CFX07453.1 putative intracellular septation protein A [Candidatus Filomicrobium marinum]CPR16607.1 putative intracellular septation protein A [Candidatus Filomicrobium marinum]SDP58252.1 intracellular septation protein [Filomicrobium insigne]